MRCLGRGCRALNRRRHHICWFLHFTIHPWISTHGVGYAYFFDVSKEAEDACLLFCGGTLCRSWFFIMDSRLSSDVFTQKEKEKNHIEGVLSERGTRVLYLVIRMDLLTTVGRGMSGVFLGNVLRIMPEQGYGSLGTMRSWSRCIVLFVFCERPLSSISQIYKGHDQMWSIVLFVSNWRDKRTSSSHFFSLPVVVRLVANPQAQPSMCLLCFGETSLRRGRKAISWTMTRSIAVRTTIAFLKSFVYEYGRDWIETNIGRSWSLGCRDRLPLRGALYVASCGLWACQTKYTNIHTLLCIDSLHCYD